MRFKRNDLRTGLLVLLTLGCLVASVIYLGAPGMIKPLVTYEVYFDTATGLQQGAPVQLAGRNIGRVTNILSPIPQQKRPETRKDLEAMVEVTVDQSARIYNQNSVRLQQIGLLGDIVVDFSQGDETSGLASPGTAFIGERQIDFNEAILRMVKMMEPVASEATKTLQQLQETAVNLKALTDKQGELNQALSQVSLLGENLVEITAKEGPLNESIGKLNRSLTDINKVTSELAKSRDIQVTLQNFRRSSERLDATIQSTQKTINGFSKGLDQTLVNVEQLTDTLKHQPWRLFWPSTKKYPGELPGKSPPERSSPPSPRRR